MDNNFKLKVLKKDGLYYIEDSEHLSRGYNLKDFIIHILKKYKDNDDIIPSEVFDKSFIEKNGLDIVRSVGFVPKFYRNNKEFFELFIENINEYEYDEIVKIYYFDFNLVESMLDKYSKKIIKLINRTSDDLFSDDELDLLKEKFIENVQLSKTFFLKTLELGNEKYLYLYMFSENDYFINDLLAQKYFDLYLKYVNKLIYSNPSLCKKIVNNNYFKEKCIEKKLFSVLLISDELDKNIYIKYYDELKNELVSILNNKRRILGYGFCKSVDFLVEILKHNDYELTKLFNEKLFEDNRIAMYYEKIINKEGNNITKHPIIRCNRFKKYCLDNNLLELVCKFGYNDDMEDIVSDNLDKLASLFSLSIPNSYCRSISLFKYYYLKRDKEKLLMFDGNILDKLGESKEDIEILDYIYSILDNKLPDSFCSSKRLFRYYIDKNDYSKIYQFTLEALGYVYLLPDDNAINYFESKVPIIMKNLDNGLPDSFKSISFVLKYCIDNNLYEYISEFNPNIILNLFKEKFLTSYEYLNLQDKFIDIFENNKMISENLYNLSIVRDRAFELEKYDLAIRFSFSVDDLDTLMRSDRLNYYCNALQLTKEELYNKLSRLYKNNDEVLKTLLPCMLHKKMNILNDNIIDLVALYPDLQIKLYNLSEKELSVLKPILLYIDDTNYDLTGILSKIINNIGKYNDLINDIDINNISKEQLEKIMKIIQREDNIYSIKTLEQIDFLDSIIDKYYENISIKIKNNSIDLDEVKRAIFDRKYGLSIDDVTFIYERYCHDLDSLKESNINLKIYNILLSIYQIYTCNDIDLLSYLFITSKKIDNNYYSSVSLEAAIRGEYARLYNESLYKVCNHQEHKLSIDSDLYKSNREVYDLISNSKYKGQHPDVYVLDGDFNLQIHVLGAYGVFESPNNYKDDWTRPKISYHGICTSYIGNNQVANARMRHPVYGFDCYENSALLCAGNYDLYSDSVISKFDSGYRKPYKMFSPKDMIDNTRHTHNEIVIERRNIGRYNMYKRMPSYVIFILDDINDKQNFNSDLYKETIQAAVDHNIPILILDRLKYVKSEKKKCEEYYNSFIQTKDYHLLYNFFLTYFNNIIGCISYDDDIKEYNKEFNLSGIMVYINKLLSDIEDFSISDKINTIKCIIDCIELENQKRDEKYISTEFLYIKLDNLKKDYNEGNKKFIVKDKRILKDIVEYYYSQNDIVQRLIYDDICNGLSRKEIINKINNNVYEGSAIYESREKYR